MKKRSVGFSWKQNLRALAGTLALLLAVGTLTAGQPGSDIWTVARGVYSSGTVLPTSQDLAGLPRVPNMLDMIDLVAQDPEVIGEAGKFGLKVLDGTADGLDYVQDTWTFKILNAGADGIGKLNDFIEEALKQNKKLVEQLAKNQDKIQNYSKKLKILDWALKGIKVAHLSGHVFEAIYNRDREQFSKSVNELEKGSLKIVGGMTGAAVGSAIGTAIGSFFGGVGAIPGSVIGGTVGAWLLSEGSEAGVEYLYNAYRKDKTKSYANDFFDWLFGPPKEAPPALPPPLRGGGEDGGAGAQRRSRPAPRLNRFR